MDFNLLKHFQVDQMVEKYLDIVNTIFSETFPQKTIIQSDEDKPWFNENLRRIKRQRLREYEKRGLSIKYWELATNFDTTFKIEREKYFQKIKLEVAEGRRGSIYPILKRLSLRLGDSTHGGFQLPQQAEQLNLWTTEQ